MRHSDLAAWAEWMRACGNREKTITTRINQVLTLCRAVGLDDPTAITTRQVVRWLAGVNGGWTRVTYWSSVMAWCRWMVAMGIREDNPMEKIPRPKSPHGKPRPVAWVVIDKILADPPSIRAYAYLSLAAFAGLRTFEIAQFRGEDIDRDTGWLFVTGKGDQRAALPLHPVLGRLAIGMDPVGYWFPGCDHGHVRAKAVSRTLGAALRAAGSNGTAHAVRHSFGTAILHHSHDVRIAQELLRHRSLSTTALYTAVDNSQLIAAVNALGRERSEWSRVVA